MWEKIRVIFSMQGLRIKILLALVCLAVFRVCGQVRLPMFDDERMKAQFSAENGIPVRTMMYMSQFRASWLTYVEIFSLLSVLLVLCILPNSLFARK